MRVHGTGQASHLIPVISDFGQVIVIKWPTDRVTIPEPGDPGNESGDQRATENPINVTGNTFHITPLRGGGKVTQAQLELRRPIS